MPTLTTKYPTKEEILGKPMKFKEELMDTLLTWKLGWWADRKKVGVENALERLVDELNDVYYKNTEIFFMPHLSTCFYIPKQHRILMNSHSIISLLHEYGHAIFGTSELKACRFSVHIFKNLFPRAYARLEWNGHMLVKHKV
jgi:hypothetical protein